MDNPEWESVLQFVSDPLDMDSPLPEKPVSEKTAFVPTPQVPTPPVSDAHISAPPCMPFLAATLYLTDFESGFSVRGAIGS